MDRLKEFLKKHRELIAYLFWGTLTTAVSFVSYTVFALLLKAVFGGKEVLIFSASATVFISNILSWICAVLFAFITNKLWVFSSPSFRLEVVLPEFVKFISSRIATGVLEIVLVPLLTVIGLNQTLFEIEGIVSKIVVNIVIIVLNYVLSKLIVFKKNKQA